MITYIIYIIYTMYIYEYIMTIIHGSFANVYNRLSDIHSFTKLYNDPADKFSL